MPMNFSFLKTTFYFFISFCLTLSTWLEPSKLFGQTCVDCEDDTEWFYPYDPCENYLTVPWSSSFSRDFVVVSLSLGFGAIAGMIAGNVAAKNERKHHHHHHQGYHRKLSQVVSLKAEKEKNFSSVAIDEIDGPTLTFAFTSPASFSTTDSKWQGLVVKPDRSIVETGEFNINSSCETKSLSVPHLKNGTYTIVISVDSIISENVAPGNCFVSNNINSDSFYFNPKITPSLTFQQYSVNYDFSIANTD
jgi:hypothetical protein